MQQTMIYLGADNSLFRGADNGLFTGPSTGSKVLRLLLLKLLLGHAHQLSSKQPLHGLMNGVIHKQIKIVQTILASSFALPGHVTFDYITLFQQQKHKNTEIT
jgi:hypothetical protein